MSWTAGTGPYAVYRSQTRANVVTPANQFGTTTGLSFDDPLSGLPGSIYYYQAAVASGCVADVGCSDGDLCNGVEHCDVVGNTCLPGTPVVCDDLNACSADSCVPATGLCVHTAATRGTPCEDGNACTIPDVCDGFGTCTGLAAAKEACNGRDDNCDGQVDEGLGTVTCGAGACQRTVAACVGGALNACMPGSGVFEVCDGIDNNCDGQVDEACNCVAVSPTGSDLTGNGSFTLPFKSIQFAITRAGTGGLPMSVCVAAGFVCTGAPAIYTGSITMRDGVSVYGGYQAVGANWPRNSSCITAIQTGTASGVVFPATIASPTILRGFTIGRAAAATTAGVTIDGAHNVTLSSLIIAAGPFVTSSYGVNLVSGAQATIRASTIDGGTGSTESIGIRSVGALPTIVGNCSSTDAQGRCTSTACLGSTPGIRGRSATTGGASYAVLLQDSPGAFIDSSALCAQNGDQSAAVRVAGNGAGVDIMRSFVQASGGASDTVGLWMEDCGGAAPWIANNKLISPSQLVATTDGDAIRAIGDCHPVIDGNLGIIGSTESLYGGNGVRCGANAAGVASRCAMFGNVIKGSAAGSQPGATGVRCEGGACARIENNTILGGGAPDVTGLWLDASGPLVAGNVITGGCGTSSATGVYARDAYARLQNNRINAGATCAAGATTPLNMALHVVAQSGPRAIDVHSNDLDGADTLTATPCTGIGLAIDIGAVPPSAGVGIYRNNIIRAGVCLSRYDVKEMDTRADPRIFENNDLDPSGSPTALYVNEAGVGLGTAAAVNALVDMTVSGVISADPMFVSYPSDLHLTGFSPCINAGTPVGAPALDMDGAPRDANPDIGADEF